MTDLGVNDTLLRVYMIDLFKTERLVEHLEWTLGYASAQELRYRPAIEKINRWLTAGLASATNELL